MGQHISYPNKQKQRNQQQQQERNQRRQAAQQESLLKLDCLRNVPPEEVEHIVTLCTFRTFLAGETIFSERQPSEFLFLLLSGSIYLKMHDKDGTDILLGVLNRGDCCGEGPLFSGLSPRAGAYAGTDCYTLQISLVDLRSLLVRTPRLQETLYRIYLSRLVESKLAFVPVFNQISVADRLTLAAHLETTCYPRDSFISRQGERGRAFYIIDSGQVAVEQDGTIISLLDEGDFFGEVALISNQPHSASIRTLTPTNILALPVESFHQLLIQYPNLKDHLHTLVQHYQANEPAIHTDPNYYNRLRLAATHGFIRGTKLLVRVPALCPPGCFICEQVCEARHGRKRLSLNGILIDSYDIPDACRQCRVGAECVEACPEDAIEWNDNRVLVITDACTGCGDCIPACPYNAIGRLPRESTTSPNILRRLGVKLRRIGQSIQAHANETTPFPYRANKCDLCNGYDDMVCISTCPTGAMRLISPDELLPQNRKKRKDDTE